MQEKKRLGSLHALRGIAFAGIFLTHCEIVPNLGGWGVSIFLVLSGFLMMYSYYGRIDEKKHSIFDNISFAWFKVRKLYPLHIIMTLVALPIVFVQIKMGRSDLSFWQVAIQLVTQVFLIQTWIPMQIFYFSLNGLSWYLSVACFCYFIFPWIYRGIERLELKQLITLGVAIYSAMIICIIIDVQLFYGNEELSTYYTYVCPLLRACDFACGCVTGAIFMKREIALTEKKATVLEALCVFYSIVCYSFLFIPRDSLVMIVLSRNVILFLPSSCLMVYLFAEAKGKITNLLTNKVSLFLADISPEGYLIHQRVLAYIIVLFTHVLGVTINVYFRMMITGTITYLCILLYSYLYRTMKMAH